METVRMITNELAIAGPLTFQQFHQLAKDGFKAILNLRSLDTYLLINEQQHVTSLGLHYINIPIDCLAMTPETAGSVLKQIDQLPKPTLVYCNNAMLAAAMVLMHISTHQGETLPQAFQRAENMGLFQASAEAAV